MGCESRKIRRRGMLGEEESRGWEGGGGRGREESTAKSLKQLGYKCKWISSIHRYLAQPLTSNS